MFKVDQNKEKALILCHLLNAFYNYYLIYSNDDLYGVDSFVFFILAKEKLSIIGSKEKKKHFKHFDDRK